MWCTKSVMFVCPTLVYCILYITWLVTNAQWYAVPRSTRDMRLGRAANESSAKISQSRSYFQPGLGAFSEIVKTLPMVSLQLYSWPACQRNISKYARKGQHLFSAEEGKGQNGKTLNLLHCIVTVCVNSRKYLIGWKNPAVAPQKVHHKIRPLQSCILKSRMRICSISCLFKS